MIQYTEKEILRMFDVADCRNPCRICDKPSQYRSRRTLASYCRNHYLYEVGSIAIALTAPPNPPAARETQEENHHERTPSRR